uniref:BTB domain-containing protein n=1 Tax=Panagrolaimus sp. ES5 TaxID=591445 RepID=A0AC34FV95_9BILA
MLSKRWNEKDDEAIKIEDFSFEVFKELLTFIYSGECNLTNENISAMIDIADFYNVTVFKKNCIEFLVKSMDTENVYEILDLIYKHSMDNLKKSLHEFISNNLLSFLKSDYFQDLQKSTMKEIVETNRHSLRQEEIFEAVFKWAEKEALEKQEIDKSLNLIEVIKEELADIIPLINFNFMDAEFIVKYVVRKSFLFPDQQLCSILQSVNKLKLLMKMGN